MRNESQIWSGSEDELIDPTEWRDRRIAELEAENRRLEDGLRSIPVTPHFNSFGDRTHNTMREDHVLALLGKEKDDG